MHDVACEFREQQGCAETISANVLKGKQLRLSVKLINTKHLYISKYLQASIENEGFELLPLDQ